MVVPLRQHRHLRIEGAQILVEQIVFVVAAKLREVFGDDGFFLRDEIAPQAAVGQFQFGLDRTVGVDVIAAMNEEVRTVFEHGGVGSHAAAAGIDAPALPGGIARPDKRYRSLPNGRGAEMPDLRFTRNPGVGDVVKPHPVENILPGRQAVQQEFRREVAVRQRLR